MAAKDKERGEVRTRVVWVNVLVLGIVMVVLGFYLGKYMLEVWKSDDIGGVQDFTASDLGDVRGESTLSDLGSSAPATSVRPRVQLFRNHNSQVRRQHSLPSLRL